MEERCHDRASTTDVARTVGRSQASTRARSDRVITVGIINDYEVVVRGVAAMLAPYDNRVRSSSSTPAAHRPCPPTSPCSTRSPGVATRSAGPPRWSATARPPRRAVHVGRRAGVRAAAQEIGVSGVVLKTRSADVLVDGIERVVAGERVGFDDATPTARPAARVVDLSDRESEVLALIAKGLTNAQIADELYLSIETVKTYVKRLYAKLDVHNRAQAAVAASSHQLTPRDAG